MGEARRRKLAGDTTPKGNDWKIRRPSRCVRLLVLQNGRWTSRK